MERLKQEDEGTEVELFITVDDDVLNRTKKRDV